MKKRNLSVIAGAAAAIALLSGCRDQEFADVRIGATTATTQQVITHNGYSIGDTSIEENDEGGYIVTFKILPPNAKTTK